MAFSIFTSNTDPAVSTIKFGSYDKSALKDGTQLTVLQTVNERTWAVEGQYIYIG